MKNTVWRKWISYFIFAVAVITVYKTFDNLPYVISAIFGLFKLFTPFIIGFVLAFLMYPATVRLEKVLLKSKKTFIRKHACNVSILCVYFASIIILATAIAIFIPRISSSVTEFIKNIPVYLNQITIYITVLTSNGGVFENFNLDKLLENVSLENLFSGLFVTDVWQYINGVKGVTSTLLAWFMGIVICAYMLLERESLIRLVKFVLLCFMKPDTLSSLSRGASNVGNIFYKFIFGKVIESIIIGGLAIIGFYLIKTPFPPILGLIIMIFNLIPYFGPFIGAIPAVTITLLSGDTYKAIWVAIFILILQQFDGIYLGPKILGDSVGVSPFWVVFAILIFGGLFGLWGMIFGIPVVAAVRTLTYDYFQSKNLELAKTEKIINKEDV